MSKVRKKAKNRSEKEEIELKKWIFCGILWRIKVKIWALSQSGVMKEVKWGHRGINSHKEVKRWPQGN